MMIIMKNYLFWVIAVGELGYFTTRESSKGVPDGEAEACVLDICVLMQEKWLNARQHKFQQEGKILYRFRLKWSNFFL